MDFLNKIKINRITKDRFLVLIEISKGSKKKYEIDKETGFLMVDRFLTTSFCYPANYGFIPLTHCDDNDPLDVFVLSQEILEPMTLIECRPLGVIRMIDNYELDEKIIAVPLCDLSMNLYQNINDLPSSLIVEIEHFLLHYKDLEQKKVVIEKIEDVRKAYVVIEKSLTRYQKINKNK
ncbi:inorganic diphosphatase [Candidatus Phytoplasma phoenicium]|uniref:Inorganic pyrophosphatase n=1 Tax=Candidatus Phytoplasma phoenicium TaxID=198422 RepID=A0A0L0MKF1_9MOLU|nr:inorganic diphosphatase [Candidatus Phytoplasma phoenicium]KND62484.1 Inorganic pyrophosphatase [Candidatus Phytoplasma phoenicium]